MKSAKKLGAWLERKRISRRLFATWLDASESFVSRLISGEKRPGREMAFRIEELTEGLVSARGWSTGTHEGRGRQVTSKPVVSRDVTRPVDAKPIADRALEKGFEATPDNAPAKQESARPLSPLQRSARAGFRDGTVVHAPPKAPQAATVGFAIALLRSLVEDLESSSELRTQLERSPMGRSAFLAWAAQGAAQWNAMRGPQTHTGPDDVEALMARMIGLGASPSRRMTAGEILKLGPLAGRELSSRSLAKMLSRQRGQDHRGRVIRSAMDAKRGQQLWWVESDTDAPPPTHAALGGPDA